MKTINVICPFDPVTRITTFPVDAEGQQYPLDWVHLTPEQGNTVVCQVRGADAVIEAMKLDPAYCWLEDVEVPTDAPI